MIEREWIEETFERLNKSNIFLCLFTQNYLDDSRCLLQFAMSIILDKPMFFLIPRNMKLSRHIIRMLDGYEFYDDENEESIKRAIINLNHKIEKFITKK